MSARSVLPISRHTTSLSTMPEHGEVIRERKLISTINPTIKRNLTRIDFRPTWKGANQYRKEATWSMEQAHLQGKGKKPICLSNNKQRYHRSGKGTPITERLHIYPLQSTPRSSLERSLSNNLFPMVGMVNQQKRKEGEVNLTTLLSQISKVLTLTLFAETQKGDWFWTFRAGKGQRNASYVG